MSNGKAIVLGLALVAGGLAGPSFRAQAQAPGYAEITAPQAGDPVSGVVSIVGTADHPAFLRYDLAFSFADNPTDTWFALGESVDARVRQGTLGLWDTASLSPGTYQLRLRVHLDNGAILEDAVTNLRVGLPALPTPASSIPQPTASVSPTPTPSAEPLPVAPPPSAGRPDPVGWAVLIGGATAAALLLLIAMFLPLRRRLAVWGASMKMRRILRQDERRRRGR